MFDWANGLIEDGIDFLQLFVLALCIVTVIIVMYRSRALVPVLGALILCGIVIFGTSDTGLTWLSDIITEETSETTSHLFDAIGESSDGLLATIAYPPGRVLAIADLAIDQASIAA